MARASGRKPWIARALGRPTPQGFPVEALRRPCMGAGRQGLERHRLTSRLFERWAWPFRVIAIRLPNLTDHTPHSILDVAAAVLATAGGLGNQAEAAAVAIKAASRPSGSAPFAKWPTGTCPQ